MAWPYSGYVKMSTVGRELIADGMDYREGEGKQNSGHFNDELEDEMLPVWCWVNKVRTASQFGPTKRFVWKNLFFIL